MEQVETKLARLRDLWNNRELDAIINMFYSEESVLIAPGPDNPEGLEGIYRYGLLWYTWKISLYFTTETIAQ